MHKTVSLALLRIANDNQGHDIEINMPTWVPYEHGLNRVVKDVIEGGYDYWLNIDSDNPPMRNPLDLVKLDKDIIGLPTPVYANMKKGDQPYYYNAMKEEGDGWKPSVGTGLHEVDAMGSGCWLVHRRVLEKMPKPCFMREYDEDGIVVRGHDFLFCKKAKECGFKIYAHFDYVCEHINELPITEVVNSILVMKDGIE